MKLILPDWIAPVVPRGALLVQHAVAVDGAHIAAVLPANEALARYPDAERVPLPGHLVVPGLVNLHTHSPMALLRGAGDDMPLQSWLEQRIWPLEKQLMSPEFVHDGSVLACAEMLRGGVTCFSDMYFFPEETASAALALGMRAALGIIAVEFASSYGSGPAEYLRKGLELRDRLRDERLISFCLAPHAPYTVSDDTLRQLATLSGELGMPVHMHLHETELEVRESIEKTGRRPLARIADLGLLSPELIAVHAVHVDDTDLRLLAAHGASVAHCPHSNLKLASGIAPVARMRELGINVGIGTDGAASNNRLDVLLEGRTAALLAKGASGNAAAWPAHQTLEAMTLAGARALGLDGRIGSIEAGKDADLVAIDLSEIETSPVIDPVSSLVYSAGREHVNEVWIAGRHVVHKRQLACDTAKRELVAVTPRLRAWHNRIGETLPVRLA